MRIRSEQMDAFRQQADEVFINGIEEHLLEEAAETIVRLPLHTCTIEEVPSDILRQMIQNGINRARNYGLTWESTLFGFVWLMFDVAPNFDNHPLIRRILASDIQPEDRRIDLLWEQISDENWKATEDGYDPNAWHVEYHEDYVDSPPDFFSFPPHPSKSE
jgi:hypothetical protein